MFPSLCMIVPTLCVGTPPVTLRVTLKEQTQSVQGGNPTQSVGTIKQAIKSPGSCEPGLFRFSWLHHRAMVG